MTDESARWVKRRIGDAAEHVTVGFVGSMSALFTDGGVPLLRGQNIKPYALDLANIKYVSSDTHQKWKKSALRGGDVAIVRVGYPGTTCVIPEGLGELNAASLVIVRPNTRTLDAHFLCYLLNSPWGQARIGGLLVGSAQQVLNTHSVSDLEIPLPPLSEQRRIAGVLAAYTDLIENCERRIRVLDEMARTLYREWFVLFRYPGHEKTPLVDSPLGRIPKGWEVASLARLTTKIGSGATPRGGKESYRSEGIALIRSMNIYDDRFEFDDLAFIDEEQARQLDNVIVEPFDVLLNITGASVARCAMVPSYVLPARVNQHVAIVRADRSRIGPHLLLDAINSDARKAHLLALAQGGATREALTKETISKFEIVVPPNELVQRYGDLAATSSAERENLRRQAENLRKTRDLLLPRLLSGQLSVDDAA